MCLCVYVLQGILAPKRSMSAYMLFANQLRAEVVKQSPEIKVCLFLRPNLISGTVPRLTAPQPSLPR